MNFFENKNKIFMFPCCRTREDHSIDVTITNVGLILTKPVWFLFSGYGQVDGQTDRHGFRILIWKHVGTQKNSRNSKLVVSNLYIPPRRSGCINFQKLKITKRLVSAPMPAYYTAVRVELVHTSWWNYLATT